MTPRTPPDEARDALARALGDAEIGCIGWGGFHDGNADGMSTHRRDASAILSRLAASGWVVVSRETVTALLDGGPCAHCRHSDHDHHTTAFPRWCGECHCIAYSPTADEYLQALVELRRSALATEPDRETTP